MCARVIRMRARELRSGPVDGRASAPLHHSVIACHRYMGFLDFTPPSALDRGDTLDFTRESSLRTISTTATVSKKKERKKRGEEIGGRLIFFFPLEEDEGERRSPRDVDESSREL